MSETPRHAIEYPSVPLHADMPLSPVTPDSMRVSPLSADSDEELVSALRSWESAARAKMALQLILKNDSLSGLLSFCTDYGRLALSCKSLQQHGVFLAFYKHLSEELWEARENLCIDTALAIEKADIEAGAAQMEELCISCGIRPGLEWLCGTECYECFDDHTD